MKRELFPVAILAGGLSTRLRPLTQTIPKSLIEINGEPFIIHQLRIMQHQGIKKVVMCVGHLGENIVEYLDKNNSFGIEISYSFDGPSLLGTGGALRKALGLLGENFFVVYGDSYLECSYYMIQKAFENSCKLGLMTVYRNEGKWDKSNVEYEDGRILLHDKINYAERMQFIDYGLGIFNKEAFDHIPEYCPYDLASLYQKLLSENQLAAFEVFERFYEIGTQAGLDELRRHIVEKDKQCGEL